TKDFCEAMMSFRSANKRLEKLYENKNLVVFRDFAHAPSKVRATIDAVREHYPDRQLISVFELHTYSSLNQNFLPQYSKTMQNSDISIVFYSKHALEIKQLPDLNTIDIIKAFDQQNLFVTTIVNDIQNIIEQYIKLPAAIVLMSSGNFDNWELNIN